MTAIIISVLFFIGVVIWVVKYGWRTKEERTHGSKPNILTILTAISVVGLIFTGVVAATYKNEGNVTNSGRASKTEPSYGEGTSFSYDDVDIDCPPSVCEDQYTYDPSTDLYTYKSTGTVIPSDWFSTVYPSLYSSNSGSTSTTPTQTTPRSSSTSTTTYQPPTEDSACVAQKNSQLDTINSQIGSLQAKINNLNGGGSLVSESQRQAQVQALESQKSQLQQQRSTISSQNCYR